VSLRHAIFSLPLEQQNEVIKTLALKVRARGGTRRNFDNLTHPILHALHAAGVPDDVYRVTRRRWRAIFTETDN
jgi:hypothetical protein